MIPLLLMLAAAADAPAMTPVDAERAFAAAAKTIGQWTAFRKWSTDDAVMFVPQPVNAHDFLKDRRDPPKAIDWWPTASYISCDGSVAVSTGGWKRPDGSVGYFTTIWQRQPDGSWQWIVDAGGGLTKPRPAVKKPAIKRAACGWNRFTPLLEMVPPTDYTPPPHANGLSNDGTLAWHWQSGPDGSYRVLSVSIITGEKSSETVINDKSQ